MRKKILIILVIILTLTAIYLYSRFIATSGLIVKEYKIESEKINNNYHGLKVVHISDLHYGRSFSTKELKNLTKKINILKPDILVLTGDLLDRDTKLDEKQINELTKQLKQIDVTINKYAIKGNHDYSYENWNDIINNAGFIDLNDNYDLIYNKDNNPIIINGMSTNLQGDIIPHNKLEKLTDFLNTEENLELNNNFKLLIMHEPDFIEDFNYETFDLILAGHSHNGQVRLPYIGAVILPDGAKNYYKEYYNIGNTDLYISSGLGTSTIDLRLFNKPSINLYRITNK